MHVHMVKRDHVKKAELTPQRGANINDFNIVVINVWHCGVACLALTTKHVTLVHVLSCNVI